MHFYIFCPTLHYHLVNITLTIREEVSIFKHKSMIKLFTTGFLLTFLSFNIYSQALTVKGTVTDGDTYDGLPGVNIQIKGTTNGTSTDIDGNYSLEVSRPDDVLIFSFIGYSTQEIAVNNRNIIDVQMEESMETMQEVVVTALGIERDKKSLGYASQSVSGDELTQARENNVINSLSGRVAGMQINQSGTGAAGTSKVTIRGSASISGANSPLYVVDGVPMANPQGGGSQFGGLDYGDGISNISPNDIESMNVLKGASATALYGSRGQNGVIMITTKKGKNRRGIGVEINSNFVAEEALVLPDFQNRFGRGSNGNFPVNSAGEINNSIRTSWGPRTFGQTEVNGMPLVNWTGEQVPYSPQPDNIRDFFRTGSTFTNAVALSGGNDKTQARLSFTHLKNESIIPNSNMQRFNVNLNINTELSEKLSVDAKLNYIKQDVFNRPNLALSSDNPMNSLIRMPRTIRLSDLQNFQTETGQARVYTNATGNDQWQNPYWAVNLNTNEDTRDRIIGYAKVNYQFADWLKMHVRTGTDFYNDFRENKNATNTIYRTTPDRSFYSISNLRFEERNSDVLFSSYFDLTEKISISGNLGANNLRITSRSASTTAQGLNIPNFFVMQNALATQTLEGDAERIVNSVYGSATFEYDDYLFVEVSARNDWSSALPANNRSYFYPAISTSFVFTDAVDINWGPLNSGKFRASYAEVGNDTGPGQLQQNYVVNALAHNGQTFGQIVSVQAPVNLRPERTSTYELGFDLNFLRSRINLEATYYNAGTVDQILRIPVSKASGFTSSILNAGLIVNQGVELSLRAIPVIRGDFEYSTFINFTRNRSRVERLAENVEVYQLGSNYDQFGIRIQAEVGGEFGDIYADRAYLRDEAGNRIIGPGGLPMPDPEGIKKIGNYQPDFLAGWGNTFSYKNITLSALIDMRMGGDIFSFSNAIAAANGNAKFTEDDRLEWYAGAGGYVAEGVTESGEPNTVEVNPQTYWSNVGGQSQLYSEEFLYDGTFIKFRELTLGYSLPSQLFENNFVNKIRVSLVGRNLFFIHKNTPGFDPEATFNAGNDQGIEAFAIPSTRSVGVNVNISL